MLPKSGSDVPARPDQRPSAYDDVGLRTWPDFVRFVQAKDPSYTQCLQLDYARGHAGLSVVVRNFGGDGEAAVYGKWNRNGHEWAEGAFSCPTLVRNRDQTRCFSATRASTRDNCSSPILAACSVVKAYRGNHATTDKSLVLLIRFK